MNVYEAAIKRIDIIFREFDNVYVSFSGGKDSGVLLNLCVDYIRRTGVARKIGLFHIDYEAQYQMTTDYVVRTLAKDQDIVEPYHVCLPLKTHCATSMHQDYWLPWEKEKQDIWVRSMPEGALHEGNHGFEFWRSRMSDYEFQEKFSTWHHARKGAGRTACLVGIRTQESLNRWRTIHSDRNYRKYNGYSWTREVDTNVYNAYPIYDWKTEDVWIANGKYGWDYNHLYDLFYMAGVPIDKMRVASPFNDWATESLKLYRVIDPNNWAKMVGRVNGVNFTAIYGGTIAMGWKNLKLPSGHTWESYMYFLLKTLPKNTRENYLQKLSTSVKFWREKGGVLAPETIQKLKEAGVKVDVGSETNYKTNKLPVRMEYIDEIDIPEFKEIPTYKRMCIAIMKNDHLCKYMGFSQTKEEVARRKNIMAKYKKIL